LKRSQDTQEEEKEEKSEEWRGVSSRHKNATMWTEMMHDEEDDDFFDQGNDDFVNSHSVYYPRQRANSSERHRDSPKIMMKALGKAAPKTSHSP